MERIERIRKEAMGMESEAVALLSELTSCVTTDYHEKNGQERLERWLKDMDCEVARVYPDPQKLRKYKEFNQGHTYEERYCVVARFAGAGGGRSLLLNAHMDTVFPSAPALWKTDPYKLTEAEGKLHALGAADDKGGMVCMLMALKMLKRMGITLKGDVIFQSVVDEEAGGGNGTLAVLDAGYAADAALVAEPNLLEPASAQIGSYALKITVEGQSAHGNMKHLGVSAFEKALPLINKLTELEQTWSARSFPLLNRQYLTVLQIKAGDGSITLPAACEMLVNFTYYPDGNDCAAELRAIIDQCQKDDPWFEEHPMKVELHHDCGPYYTDPASDWPATVAKCVGSVLGKPVEVVGLPTGADSRLFANVAHIPCVVLGPGSILACHNPNEYLERAAIAPAIAAYAAILTQWCGV